MPLCDILPLHFFARTPPRAHLAGTIIYKDGSEFRGSFVDDREEGEGVLTYPSGDTYEGTWRAGIQQGRGKIVRGGEVMDVRADRGAHKICLFVSHGALSFCMRPPSPSRTSR